MSIKVSDSTNTRTLHMQIGSNDGALQDSVFLTCGKFSVEMPRAEFLQAVATMVGTDADGILAGADWTALDSWS